MDMRKKLKKEDGLEGCLGNRVCRNFDLNKMEVII